jgi:signal transduction histidine kinase
VAEVSERLEPVAGQRDVRVELDWEAGDALVMGDENRIRQLLANLLTNGIKYAPPGTAVGVHGYLDGAEVAIDVSDTGRGIAPRDLPRIFDTFYQVPDRAEPGAGLGLAIARELAEAHGGRIDVESVAGEGTTFTARLPVWEAV